MSDLATGSRNNVALAQGSLEHAMSRLLTRSASPTEALGLAADLLAEHCYAEAVQVSAISGDSERVVEIYSSGVLASLFPSGLRRPSSGASMRTITKRGLATYSKNDLQSGSRNGTEDFSIFTTAGFNHLVAAPISLHGQNVGAVQLLSSGPLAKESYDLIESAVPLLAPYMALYMSSIDSAVGERVSISIEHVAEAVISESGLDGVCQAVVDFARGSMGIDAVLVRVVDPVDGVLRIEYRHGYIDPADIAGRAFGVIEKRLIPLAVSRGESLIIDEGSPEIFNDPEFAPLMEELPSLLITPLLDKGELLGTIEFYSLNEYAYKADHLRNVEYVANLLTSAVAHFRLIRSLSREAEIRGLLAEVARLASASDKLPSLVQSISLELNRVIPVDRVTYCMPPERVSLDLPEVGDEASTADALARIVITDTDERVCHGPVKGGAAKGNCGAKHCAVAELWAQSEDSPQGWLHLERAGKPFSDDERNLIFEIARHISPAIDTALSHEAELRLAKEHLRAERAEAEVKQQLGLNEAKQNFIATMSHELRTPLTSIRAFTDLLNRDKDSTLTAKQKKQLSVVRRNSEWLNILINDLLDLSSIDSGRFELQYLELDISALLTSLAESFGPIAELAAHDLKAILPRHTIRMNLDPNRLNQVLGNLLTNAIKYSPEATRVRMLARPNYGGVTFYVRDEGPGIPYSQQGAVFDRFVRAKSDASKKAGGTGIGLYVAKMIVESHGGYIGVTSVPDEYTTVHFWLPCEKPASLTKSSGPPKKRRKSSAA